MRRPPVVLTLTTAVALAILISLGVWQLYRMAWKQDLLARVAALRAAPARPIDEILAIGGQEGDAEFRRAAVRCEPSANPRRDAYRYAVPDGQVGWRLVSACHLRAGRFDGILLDRGVVARFTGAMAPMSASFPDPGVAIGVLRRPGGKPWLGPAETSSVPGARVFRVLDTAALSGIAVDNGLVRPAPYLLAVESEIPGPPGVVPAALPQDIPNNHLVYALTWFALAAVMVSFYGAMLFRRRTGR